jgi:hypothetical protein
MKKFTGKMMPNARIATGKKNEQTMDTIARICNK